MAASLRKPHTVNPLAIRAFIRARRTSALDAALHAGVLLSAISAVLQAHFFGMFSRATCPLAGTFPFRLLNDVNGR